MKLRIIILLILLILSILFTILYFKLKADKNEFLGKYIYISKLISTVNNDNYKEIILEYNKTIKEFKLHKYSILENDDYEAIINQIKKTSLNLLEDLSSIIKKIENKIKIYLVILIIFWISFLVNIIIFIKKSSKNTASN